MFKNQKAKHQNNNSVVQFMAPKPRMHLMKEYSKILNGIGTLIFKDNYIHENNIQ